VAARREPRPARSAPALDVEETEDGFTLHVELPGVVADDVEVSLEENVLTIAGERRFYDEKDADGFRRIERTSAGSTAPCGCPTGSTATRRPPPTATAC
jgi:HSP20 family molecular chaperone IbpA